MKRFIVKNLETGLYLDVYDPPHNFEWVAGRHQCARFHESQANRIVEVLKDAGYTAEVEEIYK